MMAGNQTMTFRILSGWCKSVSILFILAFVSLLSRFVPEKLGKRLDPDADAAGRAGSVQWFYKQKENKGQKQSVQFRQTNLK